MDLSSISNIDILVFSAYCVLVVGVALYVSRTKNGEQKSSADYFMAGNSLPWWAIGTGLIAANISAEQLIGMTGSGFAIGLGIATYEWMAAATLLIVAKFFVPIFLEKKIFTMPQFLEIRYDNRVRTSLAIFWLFLYVFVNLTSIIYLGTIAVKGVLGLENTTQNTLIIAGIVALFSTINTLSGGLMAVAWTDPIQVFFLIAGGLVTTYLALDSLGDHHGMLAGFQVLYHEIPEKFSMILQEGEILKSKPDGITPYVDLPKNGGDAYMDLPGLTVLVGAMWITNLNYWGCNQYITQKALAAKSLKEAQRGLAFAGYLKLFMPVIVVIPGMAAYLLAQHHSPVLVGDIIRPDDTYPILLNSFLFPGVKGLAFAALFAAIVGAISSKTNSIATIFTMDIYKQFFNKSASERQLVRTGQIITLVSLAIAIPVVPVLGSFDQVFQYIQEYTGFVSPGIFCIFVFGLFWKKASANAAVWVALLTLPVAIAFKFGTPSVPFLDRMGYTFIILSVVMVVISLINNKDGNDPGAIELSGSSKGDTLFSGGIGMKESGPVSEKSIFYTDPVFNIAAIGICLILTVLYTAFW
jgi:SSS family solute:Na+ symporter